MDSRAVSSILDRLYQGGDLTNGLIALSQQQAAQNAQLLMEMYALKAATDIQEAAALTLIQQAMGIGQNIDYFA